MTELHVIIWRLAGLTMSSSWELSLRVLFSFITIITGRIIYVLDWNLASSSLNVHKVN